MFETITPDDWFKLVLTLLGIIFMFFYRKAKIEESNRLLFEKGVDIAYNMVNDLSKRTENKIDDKIAIGLQYLRDFMFANTGSRELSPEQEALAIQMFSAKHGAELAAKEVMAAPPAPFKEKLALVGGLPTPPSEE